MEEERMRLYQEWRAATERYWEILSGPAPTLEAARPTIAEMERTLEALMRAYGHHRRR